jgi:hypothetical protein
MKPNNFPLRPSLDGSEELYTQTGDVAQKFTLEQAKAYIRPYKVYTALLTQSGNGTFTLTSGILTVGAKYEITNFAIGDDFSNVANVIRGTINTNGCEFIATGTTPSNYSNGSTLTDTSAPIATVLENTLGEDVVWSKGKAGSYKASSKIDFELLSTFILCGAVKISNAVIVITIDQINKDITLQTHSSGSLSDDILDYTSFEIRVYN